MFVLARVSLLGLQGFVALTALAGGGVLVWGSLNPAFESVLVPPIEYLVTSPFDTFLVPGALLILFVSGTQMVAFGLNAKGSRWSAFAAASAGLACAIWVFVQMIYIPFSFLHVVYFAIGLLELGLTMVLLGMFDAPPLAHRRSYVPTHSTRALHYRR